MVYAACRGGWRCMTSRCAVVESMNGARFVHDELVKYG